MTGSCKLMKYRGLLHIVPIKNDYGETVWLNFFEIFPEGYIYLGRYALSSFLNDPDMDINKERVVDCLTRQCGMIMSQDKTIDQLFNELKSINKMAKENVERLEKENKHLKKLLKDSNGGSTTCQG